MKAELKPRGRGITRTGLFKAEKERVGSGGKDRKKAQGGGWGGWPGGSLMEMKSTGVG